MINSKYFIDLITLKSEMAFREYSNSTQRTYTRIVEDFLEFTDKEAVHIRKEDIIRYLDRNLSSVCTNTVLVQLNALEFFFQEILGLDITENIRKYKRIYKKKDFITLAQFSRLVASVSERERLVYLIVKELGLFSEEIIEIKVEDINYQNTTLNGKKISKELAKALLEYADRNELEDRIFSVGAASLRYWNRRNTTKILGKHYTYSDLIHSIALELYIKKGDEKKASEYLKNESIPAIRQYYKRAGYDYRAK